MIRGRPFEPGNKMGRGRPAGSRNKRTLFAEEFQKDGLEAIRYCKLLALRGDRPALKTWIEHLDARKPRHNPFRLPPIRTATDWANVLPAVMQAIAAGKISAQDGEAFARIAQSHQRVIEAVEFDTRLRAVEQKTTSGSIRSDALPDASGANQGERQDSPYGTGEAAAQGPRPSGDSSMSSAVEKIQNSSSDESGDTSRNPDQDKCP